jgi:hypothetical protein
MADPMFVGAWDDLETLVFDRDDMRAAVEAASEVLDGEAAVYVQPPNLERISSAIDLDLLFDDLADDAWIEVLPAAARAVLEQARTPATQWPVGPRIPFAVARPAA